MWRRSGEVRSMLCFAMSMWHKRSTHNYWYSASLSKISWLFQLYCALILKLNNQSLSNSLLLTVSTSCYLSICSFHNSYSSHCTVARVSATDLSSSLLFPVNGAACLRCTISFSRSVPTPINIPFSCIVSFFEKFATQIFAGTRSRAFATLEAVRTIRYCIKLGSGTM